MLLSELFPLKPAMEPSSRLGSQCLPSRLPVVSPFAQTLAFYTNTHTKNQLVQSAFNSKQMSDNVYIKSSDYREDRKITNSNLACARKEIKSCVHIFHAATCLKLVWKKTKIPGAKEKGFSGLFLWLVLMQAQWRDIKKQQPTTSACNSVSGLHWSQKPQCLKSSVRGMHGINKKEKQLRGSALKCCQAGRWGEEPSDTAHSESWCKFCA